MERFKDHFKQRVRTALRGAAFPQASVAHREGNFVGPVFNVENIAAPTAALRHCLLRRPQHPVAAPPLAPRSVAVQAEREPAHNLASRDMQKLSGSTSA